VLLLDELGPDAAGPTALSPVAITSLFRFLSDEGIRVMHAVCSELERFAGGNNRIATVRARRRMCHWSTFLPTSSDRSPRHARELRAGLRCGLVRKATAVIRSAGSSSRVARWSTRWPCGKTAHPGPGNATDTPDSAISDPTEIRTLRGADGSDIALVEWSRYASVVPARRLLRFAEEGASFSRSHEELQADLRSCIAVVEEAIEEFDREDQGGLITFGEGE
jgi:hypothetical protein